MQRHLGGDVLQRLRPEVRGAHPRFDRAEGPSQGLFARNTSRTAVRQGRYLRGYAYRSIELCSPALTETVVRSSIAPKGDGEGMD